MGEERYHQYLAMQEEQIKIRIKQDKVDRDIDEIRKRFPKHLYDSDAEESDYELNDHDLNPPQRQ